VPPLGLKDQVKYGYGKLHVCIRTAATSESAGWRPRGFISFEGVVKDGPPRAS